MSSLRPDRHAPEWQVWAALLVIYIVWGSTYLAIRLVVETMPPLISASARFFVAGALLYAIVAWRQGPAALRLTRAQTFGAAFVGLSLLLGGNGLVMLGEREVASGLAALIIAVVPLWVVVLRLIFRERIQRTTVLGVLFGFAGVAVLVVPGGPGGAVPLVGMLMLVAAGASWALGSYYSKRLVLPPDPLISTAAQMIFGGAGLLIVGMLAGEVGLVDFNRFGLASIWSLAYLVVFGSVLAYTAYTWLLQHASVSRVATYAYVNPIVAIVLGGLVLHETFDLTMLVGAAMIIVAVALVLRTEARPRRIVTARLEPPA